MYIQWFNAFEDALTKKVETLVHPSAVANKLQFKRHSNFIRSHLLGTVVALLLYPVYFLKTGTIGFMDLIVFAWFISPMISVMYLCRTGNIATSHLISSLNLCLFIIVGAFLTGGIQSFLIAWMVIVPLEAALSGDRRVIMAASVSAVLSLLSLHIMGINGLIPPIKEFALSAEALLLFGIFTATSYGSAIAMSVQSEHEESERSIIETEKKFRLMAENVTDMISVHDGIGKLIFASPAAKSLFGCDSEVLLKDGLLKYVHVSDRPIYMTAISNCINDRQPVSIEYRAKKNDTDGMENEKSNSIDYIWVEMRCRWIADEMGQSSTNKGHIISVTRDISIHKTQEIELLDARNQAESSNVAKTRFLANMSHELRTPLNAIIGFSDVLKQELYGKIENQKYTDYARLINEAGEHLLSVVNDILDMSKIEVGNFTILPENFDLIPLITSCCDMMEPVANTNKVTIVAETGYASIEVFADQRAMKQMMINLLSNAIKFSEVDSKVVVKLSYENETIFIDVIDEGIGISDEDLPKLCNPFVQADSSYKRQHEGVGLGLSVVKGLAELHGGTFKISSEVGKGTTARIELPVHESSTKDISESILGNDDCEEAILSNDKKVVNLH